MGDWRVREAIDADYGELRILHCHDGRLFVVGPAPKMVAVSAEVEYMREAIYWPAGTLAGSVGHFRIHARNGTFHYEILGRDPYWRMWFGVRVDGGCCEPSGDDT